LIFSALSLRITFSHYKKEAVELKTITWDKESTSGQEQEKSDDAEEEEQRENDDGKEDSNQPNVNDLVCKIFACSNLHLFFFQKFQNLFFL